VRLDWGGIEWAAVGLHELGIQAVSAGRGDVQLTRSKARHGTGEELTGTTGALAMRLIGISGMGGEGVWADSVASS